MSELNAKIATFIVTTSSLFSRLSSINCSQKYFIELIIHKTNIEQ